MNLTISPHEKYILTVLNNKKIFFWLEYFLINDSAHQDDQLQDWTLNILSALRYFHLIFLPITHLLSAYTLGRTVLWNRMANLGLQLITGYQQYLPNVQHSALRVLGTY